MKKKINISWLPIRLGLFFLLISLPQMLSAQEERDSTHITRDNVLKPEGTLQLVPLELFPKKTATYPSYPSKQVNRLPDFSLKGDIYLPYQTNPSKIFQGDYRTSGILKQFSNGTLYGSGAQTSMPGIGRINDATLGYQHAFNRKLSLQLSANAMKINMAHITGQAFSTSGALLYRPSERVAFKVFGSYDIGNSYGMSTNLYGATMSVDISERFGMEVGVQRYYDAMRRRWETVPIAIPRYHFKKATLELDVGGLLYGILRDVVFDKQNSGGGPTIGPPRSSIPIR